VLRQSCLCTTVKITNRSRRLRALILIKELAEYRFPQVQARASGLIELSQGQAGMVA
jgi:hypothetical protein